MNRFYSFTINSTGKVLTIYSCCDALLYLIAASIHVCPMWGSAYKHTVWH